MLGRLTLLLILLFCLQQHRLNNSDSALIHQIQKTVDGCKLDHVINTEVVDRNLPSIQATNWRRLQQNLTLGERKYSDVSFLLAWRGADYESNVSGLCKPYILYINNLKSRDKENNNDYDLELIPRYLTILYVKYRDVKLLDFLLDMQNLNGVWLEENQASLFYLWNHFDTAMLREARNNRQRQATIARMLVDIANEGNDRTRELPDTEKIERAIKGQDINLAKTARQILQKIKKIR